MSSQVTQSTGVTRPPAPPFTRGTAIQKVKAAQALWNTRDPAKIALAYTEDTTWRNRDTFLVGRNAAQAFLEKKWQREHLYLLRKELFAFTDNRIAVQFFYEYNEKPDGSGQWYRAYGLEDWTFEPSGLMKNRQASINDVAITQEERWFAGLDDSTVDNSLIPVGHI